ncbi:MAG: hypothetical protein KDA21_03805, partial [Phycisphaerales bacterium]|nr:hypothetical protein [Phycisphaerales bacterium]
MSEFLGSPGIGWTLSIECTERSPGSSKRKCPEPGETAAQTVRLNKQPVVSDGLDQSVDQMLAIMGSSDRHWRFNNDPGHRHRRRSRRGH